MKRHIKKLINHFLILSTTAACISGVHAQEADPFTKANLSNATKQKLEVFEDSIPKNILVRVECFEAPVSEYRSLIKLIGKTSDHSLLEDKLWDLVKKDTVKLYGISAVSARPGETAKTESVSQHIYPTDYLPLVRATDATKKNAGDSKQFIYPTGFETSPLGQILEVEPRLGTGEDNHIISLQVELENTSFSKHLIWPVEARKDNAAAMPEFYTFSIKSGATILDGKPYLLGVESPKDANGVSDQSRKIFALATATKLYTVDLKDLDKKAKASGGGPDSGGLFGK